eukprot:8498643-Pyramimonas_sp.AAC.1
MSLSETPSAVAPYKAPVPTIDLGHYTGNKGGFHEMAMLAGGFMQHMMECMQHGGFAAQSGKGNHMQMFDHMLGGKGSGHGAPNYYDMGWGKGGYGGNPFASFAPRPPRPHAPVGAEEHGLPYVGKVPRADRGDQAATDAGDGA